MRILLVISFVAVCVTTAVHGADIGSFWQLTDIHYDANYSQGQGSSCHSGSDAAGDKGHGEFGDYNCDAPWPLVVSAINAMKLLQPNPDFIIWTGDSVPHLPDHQLNPLKVFTLIQNVTSKLLEIFTDVPVFPVLGNHDVWPADQLPPQPGGYYDNILHSAGWDSMLHDDAMETFGKGGFYSIMTPSGQRLLALNTNLYNNPDQLSTNLTDPALQLMWLEQQLGLAQSRGEKVYIIGHVPPGVLADIPHAYWFTDDFNERFLNILQTYQDCIMTTIFGHEHKDSFRIVYDKNGDAAIPMFLAPSVTPGRSTRIGASPNNPGIRLYHYDKASGDILDYEQYFLNLTAANAGGRADWLLEYKATEAYGIANISAKSMDQVARAFFLSSSKTFHKYYKYNKVSYDLKFDCDADCRLGHICAIMNISYAEFDACTQDKRKMGWEDSHFPAAMMHLYSNEIQGHHENKAQSSGMPVFIYFVIGGVVVLVSVMLLVTTLLCFRRRAMAGYFSQPQYMPINA